MEFQGKSIIRDKDVYYLIIKRIIFQKEIIVLILFIFKKVVVKYRKKRLIELLCEIDKLVLIRGNFSIFFNS